VGRAAAAFSFVLASLAPGAAARADGELCQADVDDAEVTERLAWLEARFDEHEDDVRRWWSGFVAFQSAIVGANAVLVAMAERDQDRVDPIVSLAGGLIGLGTLFVFYPPILGAGDAVRALPRGTPEERLGALRVAEERLRRSAAMTSDGRGVEAIVFSILYTEAAALTIFLLGDVEGALLQAAGGIVVSLARILLHPGGAVDAWREYETRSPCAQQSADAGDGDGGVDLTAIAPLVMEEGAGLALSLAF
jgi:hypothetical protein